MTWVLEQPVYILILGALTFAFLCFAWWQTGYRALFHSMLAVVALTAGLLILEHLVVTPREEIENALHEMAQDVLTNDLDKILPHVYSGAPQTYRQAKAEFPKYRFTRVDIKRNVEAVFPQGTNPRTKAEVTFNVVVDVIEKSTNTTYHVPRFVRLTLMFEDGEWRVAEYAHYDPHESLLPQ
jgi:hypothetical protein